jgi:hypothetical protein
MGLLVGTGAEPTFDWRPACAVNGLTVRTVENPDQVPALSTGSTYRLTLYVWLESPVPPSQQQVLDSVDFVP